ncbi:hypothetical protein GPECTOR_32g537 [Gonium pectorale]|uniref:Guanylate cyclase domain-containing protein n=1 Tax=Gonium pectorale TaxID=33097 RepID=A0A150GDK7_GONPE|nr:hypothetical protein GPECTOR_32g537 [Gonium pectorale]|eukprot:KXZ47924.1 hypothetical protein GPECTOR_32g537 [Gonium pectorale]
MPVAILTLGAAPGTTLHAPPSVRVLPVGGPSGLHRDGSGSPSNTRPGLVSGRSRSALMAPRSTSDSAAASVPMASWLGAAAAVASAGDQCPFSAVWVNASAREHLLLEAAGEYDSVLAQVCERDPAMRVLLKELGRQMLMEGPGTGAPVTHLVPGGLFGPGQRTTGHHSRARGLAPGATWAAAAGGTDSFGGSGHGALAHGFTVLRLTPCLVRLPYSAVAPAGSWMERSSLPSAPAAIAPPALRVRSSAPNVVIPGGAAAAAAGALPLTPRRRLPPPPSMLSIPFRARAATETDAYGEAEGPEPEGEPEVEQPGLMVEHVGGDQLTAAVPELYERLQRDCSILSGVSAIITLLDLHGCVLHQNALSVDYMGYHRPAPPLVAGAAVRAAAAAAAAAAGGPAGGGSALEKLFQLDPGKLPDMLSAVLDGRTWTGIVRVPPNLRGDSEERPELQQQRTDQARSPAAPNGRSSAADLNLAPSVLGAPGGGDAIVGERSEASSLSDDGSGRLLSTPPIVVKAAELGLGRAHLQGIGSAGGAEVVGKGSPGADGSSNAQISDWATGNSSQSGCPPSRPSDSVPSMNSGNAMSMARAVEAALADTPHGPPPPGAGRDGQRPTLDGPANEELACTLSGFDSQAVLLSPAAPSPGQGGGLALGSLTRTDALTTATAYLTTAEETAYCTPDGDVEGGSGAAGSGGGVDGPTGRRGVRERSSMPAVFDPRPGVFTTAGAVAAAMQGPATERGGSKGYAAGYSSKRGRASVSGSAHLTATSVATAGRGVTSLDATAKPKRTRSAKFGLDLQAMNTSAWALVGSNASSPSTQRRPAGPPAFPSTSAANSPVFFAAGVRRKSVVQQQQQLLRRRTSALAVAAPAYSSSQLQKQRTALDASAPLASVSGVLRDDEAKLSPRPPREARLNGSSASSSNPAPPTSGSAEAAAAAAAAGSSSGQHAPANGNTTAAMLTLRSPAVAAISKRSGRLRVRPVWRRAVGVSAPARYGVLEDLESYETYEEGDTEPDADREALEEEEDYEGEGAGARLVPDSPQQQPGQPCCVSPEVNPSGAGAPGAVPADAAAGGEPDSGDGAGGTVLPEAADEGDEAEGLESSSEDSESDGDARWHEVSARPFRDPVTRRRCILLMQMDVTAKVETERRLAELIEAEHKILEQIFPRHVLEHMALDNARAAARPACAFHAFRRDCSQLATKHEAVTILFADIKGFTSMCKEVEPEVVMTFLNDLYNRFDTLLDVYGVYKVETIGDCYMVAGGLIRRDEDGFVSVHGPGAVDPLHAVRVMSFAKAMLREAGKLAMPRTGEPLMIRVGIHSGPVTSGVVGTRMPRFCLFGDTVNTASRMESTAEPGTIHVSGDTKGLLSGEYWGASGGVEVKGKGLMHTYVWLGNENETAPHTQRAGSEAHPDSAAMRLLRRPQRSSTSPREPQPLTLPYPRGDSLPHSRYAKRSATAPREMRRNALSITTRLFRTNASRVYERRMSTLGRRTPRTSEGGAGPLAAAALTSSNDLLPQVEERTGEAVPMELPGEEQAGEEGYAVLEEEEDALPHSVRTMSDVKEECEEECEEQV